MAERLRTFCKSPKTGASACSGLYTAICSVSSRRLQNHWWPSRSTRLNINSRSFSTLSVCACLPLGFQFPQHRVISVWLRPADGQAREGKLFSPTCFSFQWNTRAGITGIYILLTALLCPLIPPLCYLRVVLYCQDSEMSFFLFYKLSNWISPHYIKTGLFLNSFVLLHCL